MLQLIGVTFIAVQCLVLLTRTRQRFTIVAVAIAVVFVALSPTSWAIDWSRWLPIWAWAYLSPVLGYTGRSATRLFAKCDSANGEHATRVG